MATATPVPSQADAKRSPTPCAARFPGLPENVSADTSVFPNPLPNVNFHDYAIEDRLKVPKELPPGDYVLGWRWDCEESTQVWANCADVTITKRSGYA